MSSERPAGPPAVSESLPILKTMGRAHLMVARNLSGLLIAAFLPVMALAALSISHFHLPIVKYRIESLGCLLAAAIPIGFLSVVWLRIIMAEDGARPFEALKLSGRSLRSAVHCMLWAALLILSPIMAIYLQVLPYLIAAILSGSGQLPDDLPALAYALTWGSILLLWYFFAGRLLLILPAAAMNRDFGRRESWRFTFGQGLRISLALFATTVSAATVGYVMLFMADFAVRLLFSFDVTVQLADATAIERTPRYIAGILVAVFGTSLMSNVAALAYWQLVSERPPAGEKTLEAFD